MRDFAIEQFCRNLDKPTAQQLEAALYQFAVDEVQIPMADWEFDCVRQVYKHKLRALVTALRNEPTKIAGQEINVMLHMSPSELNPSVWEEVASAGQDTLQDDGQQDARYGEVACSSCLRRGQPCHNTAYTQLQTRSADEGLTNYCLCYNCGKRWRQS